MTDFNIGEKEETNKNLKVTGHGEVGERGCPCKVQNVGEEEKQCGSTNVVQYKKLHQGNRVYHCRDCGTIFASPTSYARCDNEYIVREKGGIIGSDLVVNDCLICPIARKEGFDVMDLAQKGEKCPYFIGPTKLDE